VKTRRNHTREFKLDLCSRIDAGAVTRAAACREHHLAPSLLGRWMEQYRDRGNESFSDSAGEPDKDKRIAQLERALGQAYLDIKILTSALHKKGGVSEP